MLAIIRRWVRDFSGGRYKATACIEPQCPGVQMVVLLEGPPHTKCDRCSRVIPIPAQTVVYDGKSRWLLVSKDGHTLMTTGDGITWTERC